MAFCRLYLLLVLMFLALPVNGNVITTPVAVKSETKPLTGRLLANLTSLKVTTSPTIDKSSQPIITTEFKRGQYTILHLLSFVFLCCDVYEFTLFRSACASVRFGSRGIK